MIHDDRITPFQLGCLCFAFMSGFSTLYLLESKLVLQDVWIANLAALSAILVFLKMIAYVQRHYPYTDMSAIIEILFGKWAGKLILTLFMLGMTGLAALSLRSISIFYTTAILPSTSSNLIMLLVLIVTTYAVTLGLGSIARSVLAILPFFIVAILVIFVFIYQNVDVNPFLPQFQHPFPLILYGAMISFGFPFGKMGAMMFVFSKVTNQKKLFKSCSIGIIVSGLYLMVSAYLTIGSLGENMFKSVSFPFFSSIQLVKFGEYIERIEIIIIGIWTILILFEIIMVQYVFVNIMAKMFGLKEKKPFIIPAGVFFFAVAMRSYRNPVDLLTYDKEILPFAIIIPSMIVPACLVGLTWIKKRRGGRSELNRRS